jgi:hypothetical protein
LFELKADVDAESFEDIEYFDDVLQDIDMWNGKRCCSVV